MDHCPHCWNPINWCESFAKYGHDDGDDCVHTLEVARALRRAGYYVKVQTADDTLHNPIVLEVGEEGEPGELKQFFADDIPAGTVAGMSNPREVLPPDVVAMLDRIFGQGEFHG
jgi:hypothetical protein